MDEAWERAVEAALEGQAVDSSSPPRALTLDGAVKCLQGRLPPPGLLERYQSLEHLSIASVGVSSLVAFPRLRNLRRLILSDNRIAGGLEFLVEAGLDSLRDLDLSNNRIQFLEDLAPLARLRLVSLDLYECPVTRVRDYRTKVFAMIRSLKYLDKMDADENERPETDEEDDEEEEEEEEEEDPGSGEIDGEDRTGKVTNGVVGITFADGIVGVDEDDESDADEEVETVRTEANGLARGFHHHHLSNGFRVAAVGEEDEEEVEEDVEYDDVNGDDANEDLAEEIDEDDGEDEGVVEVHDIAESDEDVEEMEEEEEIEEQDGDEVDGDGDGDEDEEDVDDEEEDGEPGSTARMTSTDGEIDGHDQGEEDENGEIGEEDEERAEEELNFEEDDEGEDEEEDLGGDYLLQQHVDQVEIDAGGSDFDACNGEDEDGVDDNDNAVVDDRRRNNGLSSSSHPSKRKRGGEDDVNEDDCVKDSSSSKHR